MIITIHYQFGILLSLYSISLEFYSELLSVPNIIPHNALPPQTGIFSSVAVIASLYYRYG